jgi:tRNA dimethylallyltransferase
MIEHGMIDEAKRVLPYKHCNALNTVGYKELFEYFEGALSLDEAIAKIKSNTRRYARKQLTWYKRDASVTWFEPSQNKQIIQHILNEMQTDTAKAQV